jgi:hypothetical protein
MIEKPTPEQTSICGYAGKICFKGSILRECLVNNSRLSCEYHSDPEIYPKCFMALAHKRYLKEIANLSTFKE